MVGDWVLVGAAADYCVCKSVGSGVTGKKAKSHGAEVRIQALAGGTTAAFPLQHDMPH